MKINPRFNKIAFKEGEEERLLKKCYDISIPPKVWMARFGHNQISGDMRVFIYKNIDLKNWIYEAFEALTEEGLSSLRNQYLSKEEIESIEKMI